MYYSDYGAEFLASLASKVSASASSEIWCVFDNTASGAALGNALTLSEQLVGMLILPLGGYRC